jgi:DNA polymerase-1
LLEGIDTTEEACKELIEKYWRIYQQVPLFRQFLYAKCRQCGFVKNIIGRPLLIEGINSEDFGQRKQAERRAINNLIQSSAADLLKQHMIHAAESCILRELKCFMLMQVHDELIFEVPTRNVEPALAEVKRIMETDPLNAIIPLPIRFPCSIGFGPDWKTAKG